MRVMLWCIMFLHSVCAWSMDQVILPNGARVSQCAYNKVMAALRQMSLPTRSVFTSAIWSDRKHIPNSPVLPQLLTYGVVDAEGNINADAIFIVKAIASREDDQLFLSEEHTIEDHKAPVNGQRMSLADHGHSKPNPQQPCVQGKTVKFIIHGPYGTEAECGYCWSRDLRSRAPDDSSVKLSYEYIVSRICHKNPVEKMIGATNQYVVEHFDHTGKSIALYPYEGNHKEVLQKVEQILLPKGMDGKQE